MIYEYEHEVVICCPHCGDHRPRLFRFTGRECGHPPGLGRYRGTCGHEQCLPGSPVQHPWIMEPPYRSDTAV